LEKIVKMFIENVWRLEGGQEIFLERFDVDEVGSDVFVVNKGAYLVEGEI